MISLPSGDPALLASVINMYLRDGEFRDLDDICAASGRTRGELEAILSKGDFVYSAELNKVR